MPFKSKAQQKWMFAAEERGEVPEGTAERWAHHTKNIKALPEHVDGKDKKSHDLVAGLALAGAMQPYVDKLAADAGLSADEVSYLSLLSNIPPAALLKQAYDDPEAFAALICLGLGQEKRAVAGGWLSRLWDKVRGAGSSLGHSLGTTAETTGQGIGRMLGQSEYTPRTARILGGTAMGAGGLAGVGGLYAGGRALFGGGGGEPAPVAGGLGGGLGGGPEPAPVAQGGGLAPPGGGAGGMNPKLKALLLAGALGGGAYGLTRMLRGRRREKESGDADFLNRVLRRAALTKVGEFRLKEARALFTSYLDVLAAGIPTVEKRAAVRQMQLSVSRGRPLSVAIKEAYPRLSGEERGILANRLCKAAVGLYEKLAQGALGGGPVAAPTPMQPGGGVPNTPQVMPAKGSLPPPNATVPLVRSAGGAGGSAGV